MKIRKLARVISEDADGKASKEATGEIRVEKLPGNGKQRISTSTLEKFANNFDIEEDRFVLNTVDGKVIFNVLHEPGRHCLTCGERLPDFGGNGSKLEAVRAAQCRAHVATHGNDAILHPNWPHGYANRPETYTCTIEDQRGH